jgi:hypothetical protein
MLIVLLAAVTRVVCPLMYVAVLHLAASAHACSSFVRIALANETAYSDET